MVTSDIFMYCYAYLYRRERAALCIQSTWRMMRVRVQEWPRIQTWYHKYEDHEHEKAYYYNTMAKTTYVSRQLHHLSL